MHALHAGCSPVHYGLISFPMRAMLMNMRVTLLLCERQASHAADTLALFRSVGTGSDLLSFPGIAGSSGRRGALMADILTMKRTNARTNCCTSRA